MCYIRFTISTSYRKEVERHLKTAQHLGPVRQVKYLLAILAVIDGQSVAQVALVLRVHAQTVATWVQRFCCYGLQGAPRHKPAGRPPKLTPHKKPPCLPGLRRDRSRPVSVAPAGVRRWSSR